MQEVDSGGGGTELVLSVGGLDAGVDCGGTSEVDEDGLAM